MDDGDGKDSQEWQLRQLLEHAVPILQAPPDRLRQVRRRVVARRRRRRAVGVTVTVASALVLFYGSFSAQLGLPTPLRTQAASPATEERRVDLSNRTLHLDLPHGWYLGERTDQQGEVTVFVGNRPLETAGRCSPAIDDDYDCAPKSALAEGEALISFRPNRQPSAVDSGGKLEPTPYPRPAEGCRSLRGDQEMVLAGWTMGNGSLSFPVDAHVCFRGASEATRAEAARIVVTARASPKK